MGRVKQNKKSTFIDMTAMSDVTVLLLTFFMLTSTFLAKEPFQATVPPSVSEEEMPMTNVVEILVNPQGKVWLTMNNDTTQKASNAKMRVSMLKHMSQIYRAQTGKSVSFNSEDSIAFAKLGAFGVPFQDLPKFLQSSPDEQDAWLTGKEEANGKITGIPISEQTEAQKDVIRKSKNQKGLDEFQMWIEAAVRAAADLKNTLSDKEKELVDKGELITLEKNIKEGRGFALKGDQNSPFKTIHMVMDNMQTIGRNKFTLVTALKTEKE